MICSCTITKRHFGSGYYVEWNRKVRTGSDSDESSKIKLTDTYAAKRNNIESDSLITDQAESTAQVTIAEVSELETKQVIEDQKVEESPFQSKVDIRISQEIKTIESKVTKEKEDEVEEVPERRMHPLMWGIWGMWSIAIACMFFVTFYAEALIGVGLGFFIAMIFAIIVLRGIRKHPEKYKFKRLTYPFAILAIVFGGIALAGLLLFLAGGYGISY